MNLLLCAENHCLLSSAPQVIVNTWKLGRRHQLPCGQLLDVVPALPAKLAKRCDSLQAKAGRAPKTRVFIQVPHFKSRKLRSPIPLFPTSLSSGRAFRHAATAFEFPCGDSLVNLNHEPDGFIQRDDYALAVRQVVVGYSFEEGYVTR
jgi:hypothetical protein